jgi:hypothetical protein
MIPRHSTSIVLGAAYSVSRPRVSTHPSPWTISRYTTTIPTKAATGSRRIPAVGSVDAVLGAGGSGWSEPGSGIGAP